ncbi:MAG: hypothetical protein NTX22_06620 [Ignavibacteriales bacterium]|nr:hypothetical protein [Ignavibacteriales bacterium]
MASKIFLKYNLPYTNILTAADTINTYYADDEKDFKNFNNSLFTDSFKSEFLAEVAAAKSLMNDFCAVEEQLKEIDDIKKIIALCTSAYQELKFFVERTFPGNLTVWNQFGFIDYSIATSSLTRLIQFMGRLCYIAEKFKDVLANNGYSTIKLIRLNNLKDELIKEVAEQSEAKKNGASQTSDRINSLNKVWEKMVDINEASLIIFKNNYAKLQKYLLPSNNFDFQNNYENKAIPSDEKVQNI